MSKGLKRLLLVLILAASCLPTMAQSRYHVSPRIVAYTIVNSFTTPGVHTPYGTGTFRSYDVCYPVMADLSAQPIVVLVHGGGWVGGGSQNEATECQRLARIGWVAYAINFMLADMTLPGDPTTRFPAQIVDIHSFLSYIAEGLGVGGNLSKISLVGESSGAHLALLTSLVPKTTWPATEHTSTAYTMVCAATQSTPTDLNSMYSLSAGGQPEIEELLGYQPPTDPTNADIASPIHYISSGAVPIQLQVGTLDTLVPYATQSGDFATAQNALRAGSVNYLVYPNVTHGGVQSQYLDLQTFLEANCR